MGSTINSIHCFLETVPQFWRQISWTTPELWTTFIHKPRTSRLTESHSKFSTGRESSYCPSYLSTPPLMMQTLQIGLPKLWLMLSSAIPRVPGLHAHVLTFIRTSCDLSAIHCQLTTCTIFPFKLSPLLSDFIQRTSSSQLLTWRIWTLASSLYNMLMWYVVHLYSNGVPLYWDRNLSFLSPQQFTTAINFVSWK